MDNKIHLSLIFFSFLLVFATIGILMSTWAIASLTGYFVAMPF